jgi:heat shock protein HtpX
MMANLSIPNAFAYGSPLTGNMVAVTKGLLGRLELEEVEAVIGHELGHLRHRDVQVMMFASFLPSLFYLIARSTLYPYYYGYYARRRRGNYAALALVGTISMLIYFILLIFTLALSRLREYYADQHSASIVDDGARKLAEALAKISTLTSRMERAETVGLGGFKTLFIADPDRAVTDAADVQELRYGMRDEEVVRRLLERRLTWLDRFAELFSTHPHIVKRLRALIER